MMGGQADIAGLGPAPPTSGAAGGGAATQAEEKQMLTSKVGVQHARQGGVHLFEAVGVELPTMNMSQEPESLHQRGPKFARECTQSPLPEPHYPQPNTK